MSIRSSRLTAHGYPPSTPEERAEFEVFWAQCQADWRFEIAEGLGDCAPYDDLDLEPVSPAAVSPVAGRPELIDGPTIPADLDLTEVFGAVPPEHLFDEDLREEFLYTNYLADNFLPDDFLADDSLPAEGAAGEFSAGADNSGQPDPEDDS
ncbi:hypothetical protein E3O11_00005, partial [Cryobacterium levicorallinum]